MNMQNLMAQAQKIQKDIQKKQSDINSTIYSTQNEFLSIEMYGSKKIHKIRNSKRSRRFRNIRRHDNGGY